MSDMDRMLLAKQGVETAFAQGKIHPHWVKKYPLFFMALPDEALYEDATLKNQLASLFKSHQSIHNYITKLVDIDENYDRAMQFSELIESNIDFRKKFYKFFLRMFLSTTVAGWTNRASGFSGNYYSGGKRRQVNDMMRSTFGNNELCHGHLTINDTNKLVEDIANSKMSFKSYCVKNFLPEKRSDSYGYERIIHKALPGSGQYGESYAKIQVDQIWPDVEIPVATTSS
tara:strand:+ start:3802 stop:4488 length:687 start_codon:yes stop_codon:yes gene_type:complete